MQYHGAVESDTHSTAPPSPAATRAPWPSMRGNLRNTGCSLHAIAGTNEQSPLHITTGNAIFSTPVIDADENVYIGSADEYFYCIDTRRRCVAWRRKTDGIIDSAGCLDDRGAVYVPSGDASIYQLSTADGSVSWRMNLLERATKTSSTIFWWEGNVVQGPNGWLFAGNDDFCLYAISPDGHVQWSMLTALQIWSAPAFQDDLLYVASFDMCLYAVEWRTGRMVWCARLHNVLTASPAVGDDGTVYVSCFGGYTYALDGRTGRRRWTARVGGSIYASAALTPDGGVWIGSGNGHLTCLDQKTGGARWTYDANCPIWSSASIGIDPHAPEDFLGYVGTTNGELLALRPTGEVRWRYDVGGHMPGRRVGLNASIALGTRGLATATTDGRIIYIPYGAVGSDTPAQAATPAEQEPATHPLKTTANGTSLVNRTFSVTKMECVTPAIINPLDQIGIASLSIDAVVIAHDAVRGRIVAWGVQTFGIGETHDGLGTPFPRRHFYAFNGDVDAEGVLLEARQCDFDITAFPIPLDRLTLHTPFEQQGACNTFAAFVDCNGIVLKVLRKYGWRLLRYSGTSVEFTAASLWRQCRSAVRTVITTLRMVKRRVWRPMGLLDDRRHFDARGTFWLKTLQPHTPRLRYIECTYDAKRGRVRAVFALPAGAARRAEFPGIVLVDTAETRAVPIDYEREMRVHTSGDRITATLFIPHGMRLPVGSQAVILLGTTVMDRITLA